MRHQEILFGVTGQTFYLDVPEGRVDAGPAVTVLLSTESDDAGGELATTGVVTLDACNTTLSAIAAAGANVMTLTDVSSVKRLRRYLVTAADGTTAWVDVTAVDATAHTVTIRRPLSHAFAVGASFQSTRISIAVRDGWAADMSRVSDILGVQWRTDREPRTEWPAGYVGYRLRWTYAVAGVNTVAASFADLVRYSAKNLVTPNDVDARFPGFIDRLPLDHQNDQGASLVYEAFYAFKLDAIADGEALRRIRNTEIVRELVIHRANVIASEARALAGATTPEQLKLARDLYRGRYDQLLRDPKFQADQTGAGQAGQARKLPAFRR